MIFDHKSLIFRLQKSQNCQFRLSTKQSFPSIPDPRDYLIVMDIKKVPFLHRQVILTPASMVIRPPGVAPCTMETPRAYQLLITLIIIPLRHLINILLIILHLTPQLQHLIIIKHLTLLLLQSAILGQFTLTEDQASTNFFSKFTRLSCILAGNR